MKNSALVYQTDEETLFLREDFPSKDPWKNVKVVKKNKVFEVWECQSFVSGKETSKLCGTFTFFHEAKKEAQNLIGLTTVLESQKKPTKENIIVPLRKRRA